MRESQGMTYDTRRSPTDREARTSAETTDEARRSRAPLEHAAAPGIPRLVHPPPRDHPRRRAFAHSNLRPGPHDATQYGFDAERLSLLVPIRRREYGGATPWLRGEAHRRRGAGERRPDGRR